MYNDYNDHSDTVLWNPTINPFPRTGEEIRQWCCDAIAHGAGNLELHDLALSLLSVYWNDDNPNVFSPKPDTYYYVIPGRNHKEPDYILLRDELRSPRMKKTNETFIIEEE